MNILADLKELQYRNEQVERAILVEEERKKEEARRTHARTPKPRPRDAESDRMARGGLPRLAIISPEWEAEQKRMRDERDAQKKAFLLDQRPNEDRRRAGENDRQAWALYRQLRDESVTTEDE